MTKQEFETLQMEIESSPMSIKDFMSSKSLPVHRYYYWKKRHMGEESINSKGFIQIQTKHEAPIIKVEYPNGVTLNLHSYPGTKALLKLINKAN